jgi:ATP-binding cassette subfamily F protein uup
MTPAARVEAGSAASAALNERSSSGHAVTALNERSAPGAAPARQKLSYKEQRELAELPGRIEALEAEQKLLSERLADPGTYGQGAVTHGLHTRFAEIEEELMNCLERWSELESRTRP